MILNNYLNQLGKRARTKELSELSQASEERSCSFFYLLVDEDNIPLMIDQPEKISITTLHITSSFPGAYVRMYVLPCGVAQPRARSPVSPYHAEKYEDNLTSGDRVLGPPACLGLIQR